MIFFTEHVEIFENPNEQFSVNVLETVLQFW